MHHVASIKTNVVIFVWLMVLLFATVAASYMPLGVLHFPVAMTIATAKAILIVLFFMHALHSHRLTLIISVASLMWLMIMMVFTLGDYLSRGWLDIPGK
jgi:cytochrome c oxidase subunit 4